MWTLKRIITCLQSHAARGRARVGLSSWIESSYHFIIQKSNGQKSLRLFWKMTYFLDGIKDPGAQGPCLSLSHCRSTGLEVPQKLPYGFPARLAAGTLSLWMWLAMSHVPQSTKDTCFLSLRKENRFLIWILPHHSPTMRDLTRPSLQTSRNTLLSLQMRQTPHRQWTTVERSDPALPKRPPGLKVGASQIPRETGFGFLEIWTSEERDPVLHLWTVL